MASALKIIYEKVKAQNALENTWGIEVRDLLNSSLEKLLHQRGLQ